LTASTTSRRVFGTRLADADRIGELTMASVDLSGRTAIVTGASRGIGFETARGLVAAGANVVLTSRRGAEVDEAAGRLGERAAGFEAHATDQEAAGACVAFAIERFGSLDILVNNAGINAAFGPLVELEHAGFAETLDVNVWGPVLWSGLAWRAWMGEHGGVVVNNASAAGLSVAPRIGAYAAAKAALIHLTRHLALELAPLVRVNAVAPGVVRTEFSEMVWKDNEETLAATVPLGRVGEASDAADVIVFGI
jgi:NAD(P)-dependent dehydrogenase (short-subunit alcohol dehydrogenase family)